MWVCHRVFVVVKLLMLNQQVWCQFVCSPARSLTAVGECAGLCEAVDPVPTDRFYSFVHLSL